jgi:hypothetical protein
MKENVFEGDLTAKDGEYPYTKVTGRIVVEKERDAWKKIASDADEFRQLYEKAETRCAQQAEALRAAREYAAKNQYETGGVARAALQVVGLEAR